MEIKEKIIIVKIETEVLGLGKDTMDIKTVRVTTNNHGYDFVVDYNIGKNLKIGDKLTIKINDE